MNHHTVDIAGKQYPVSFGMFALANFCKQAGLSLSDMQTLGDNLDLLTAIQLVHEGLRDGHRKADKAFDLKVEDVADLLDEDDDALERILGVFTESMAKEGNGKPKAGAKKATAKK